MAEILFENDGLKMWTDGYSPIVFVKFSSPPSLRKESEKLIQKGQSALRTLLSKSESVYSIIDISECHDRCSLSLLRFCFTRFPQLLGAEIKYLAVVHATTHTPAVENNLTGLITPQIRKGCFRDFFGALGKINAIMQRQFSIHL
jgi:hypothetical protein